MRIEHSEYAVAPRDDPLVYPGKIPDFSFIYLGEHFYKLNMTKGRRAGKARIVWSKERPKDIAVRGANKSLDNCLLNLNATSLDWRYPVLAYGSNASPSQLQRKLSGRGGGSVVPVVRATVLGLDVVYSAHMAWYGAIPATLIASPGAEVMLHVTFLDDTQLRLMDTTESTYVRVRICGNEFPLTLETGETLSEYYAYLSRYGALLFDNHPVRLANIPASLSSLQSANEEEVLSRVVDLVNQHITISQIDHTVDLLDKIRNSQLSATDVTACLGTHFGEPDIGIPQETSSHLKFYSDIPSEWSSRRDDEIFTVLPNYDREPGDYAIAVHPNVAARLQLGHFAVVEHQADGHVFSLIAALSSDQVVQSEAEIHIDQTIRDAIGVGVRERVRLYPLPSHGGILHRLINRLLPRKYLVMRVQSAHILMIEKPGCMMSQIAMDILGVEPGDEVILESAVQETPDSDHRLARLTLRAYPTPPDAQELRERTQSGMLQSRFPDCSEALGVFPDLPWLFIDADARNALGRKPLGLDKCSPIRVYASRKYQLIKEFREYAFLIIVTLLSAISLLDVNETVTVAGINVPLNLLLIGPAVLIAAFLIYVALRRRMSP